MITIGVKKKKKPPVAKKNGFLHYKLQAYE